MRENKKENSKRKLILSGSALGKEGGRMKKVQDTYGEIQIPDHVLWGKNTARSLKNFAIGTEKMPGPLIRALLEVKRACAEANMKAGKLDQDQAMAIVLCIDDLLDTTVSGNFPLSVWQTGSGTQTNMNANEVIAGLAEKNLHRTIHPNDEVNMGQSTNDVFPAAIHIMAVTMMKTSLFPALDRLIASLEEIKEKKGRVVKTARTHLMDAVPMTFGQEVGAWISSLEHCRKEAGEALERVFFLGLGGTAVGTGINSYAGFGQEVVNQLNLRLHENFKLEEDRFHFISSRDALLGLHGALNDLASDLLKIGNDIRLEASGPRTGLGELRLPANEAGSSIMPGKVNPTQIEAMAMVAVRVMGNQTSLTIANSQGNFQLNAYLPLFAQLIWQSIRLLSDVMDSFTERCLKGMEVCTKKMEENLEKSLMTATFLNPYLGYDQTTKMVKKADQERKSIREVVLEEGLMSEEEFDRLFNPQKMTRPQSREEEEK